MDEIEKHGHGGDLQTASEIFQLDEFVDFSANINPLGPPKRLMSELISQLNNIVHYPDPIHRRLVGKIAKKYNLTSSQLLIGNGASECMTLIIQALKPKTVGLIYPSFHEYERISLAEGARIKRIYGIAENFFKPNRDELEQLIRDSELIFIGNPSNPVGTFYTKIELVEIVNCAKQYNTIVVIDEAFIDFIDNEAEHTIIHFISDYENLIIVRSMTKFYAIPGLRLGFSAAHESIITKMKNKQVAWSVNHLALVAGEVCLDEFEYAKETKRLIENERNFLTKEIKTKLNWNVYPSVANFLFIRLNGEVSAKQLQRSLGEKGILIRSCANYPGLTKHDIRIAVRTRKENERLIETMVQFKNERL